MDWIPSGLSTTWTALLVVLTVGAQIISLGTIPKDRKPSSAMAWLILIFVAPIIGLALFFFFGAAWLDRRRHHRQTRVLQEIDTITDPLPDVLASGTHEETVVAAARLNRSLGSFPLVGDNTVELIADYQDVFDRIAEDIDAATTRVHIEYYILAWDDTTNVVLSACERARERGVIVRILCDHVGTWRVPGYRRLKRRLNAAGFHWHVLLPIQPWRGLMRRPDLRNHRKIVVVDDAVAYTGSQNLIEPGYHKNTGAPDRREWVELMARYTGPAVLGLDAVFAQDWYTETAEAIEVHAESRTREPAEGHHAVRDVACQLVPSGPGYPQENNLRLFTSLMYSAERRICLVSPYFVPDETLLYAVTTAALRGVHVELFVNEKSDQFMVGHAQASYYQQLLEAGVKIWMYPAPAVLHAKHFTVDDTVALIGSSNMDMRSFALNYEASVMMTGAPIVAAMREVEDTYRDVSKPLTLDQWKDRSLVRNYLDNVLRLTASLQ